MATEELTEQSDQKPAPGGIDILATYRDLLATNPSLTQSAAAIESLIAVLRTTSTSTVHETTEILEQQRQRLKRGFANSIAISAGADLFVRYLVSSLKKQERDAGHGSGHAESFEARRARLVSEGAEFAERAVKARSDIARLGAVAVLGLKRQIVGRVPYVLTYGNSRAVAAVLARAADEDRARRRGAGCRRREPDAAGSDAEDDKELPFMVAYVEDPQRQDECDSYVADLRRRGVLVSVLPMAAVAFFMDDSPPQMVLVGAEAVTSDCGFISRMGTYGIAQMAKARNVRFYVAAETHKFAKMFVSNNYRLGVHPPTPFRQDLLDPSTNPNHRTKYLVDAVDHTHAKYVDGYITEAGIKLPHFVFDSLLSTYDTLISEQAQKDAQEAIASGKIKVETLEDILSDDYDPAQWNCDY